MKVIVIGASAGGSPVLAELLGALPADYPLPILVVKHQEESSGRDFVNWLDRKTALDVHLAEDGEPLQGGAIVLAPAGYHLLLEADKTLSLSLDEPVVYARPSLDVLFESAALACGDQVLCMVLTGANHDGAAGAEAIRKAGGQVFVQNPEAAEVPVMPRAALGKSGNKYALDLWELVEKLLGLANE